MRVRHSGFENDTLPNIPSISNVVEVLNHLIPALVQLWRIQLIEGCFCMETRT
jgi:hypothetical protein